MGRLDELVEAEAQLLSRVTYEGFAAAWPQMEDEAGFAAKVNSMPKYVVSSTLERADWHNTTILSGDPTQSVAALKRLFPEGEAKRPLKLIEAKTVGDGISLVRYERG